MPERKAQDRVNDFVIKIGTVNGTGSASANGLLMKAIFRSGVPVVGKNYFPSNIQGLPTWYEIRVTRDGHRAREGRIDLMVALNVETYARDLQELASGGYFVYDSTWPRPALLKRDDVTVIGVPLAQLCNENFQGVRTRILMKNICYAGVLAALCALDLDIIRALLQETYAKKPQLVEANMKAIQLGYDYARDAFRLPAAAARGEDGCHDGPHHHRRQHRGRARLRLCRRHGGRLVSDHALDLADGCVQGLLRPAARRCGHRPQELHHDPGRG